MKYLVRLLSLVFAITLAISVTAWAQQSNDTSRGRGGGRRGFYNPETVTTISGTVVSVDTQSWQGRGGGSGGAFLSLTLSVSTENLTVRLGPSTYFEEQKITIKPKDKLKIKASKVERNGNISYVAAEISKDKSNWTLRESDGTPKWRRQGGNQQSNQ